MDRANAIRKHPVFAEKLGQVVELERGRTFCRHGMDHLLDVARIAYILYLERAIEFGSQMYHPENTKEMIYASALLHDIGRARQYEDGTPHEQESARIAQRILPECGFCSEESTLIIDAILSHRTSSVGCKGELAKYIYRADKLSRRCCDCAAIENCDWELKNALLEY